jgi:hypothetical protein
MNMISTGAFLNEMDASNKQEGISEKFVRVWEKKNAKAARAGGVSLMALSLAACGSSSTTTTTTTTDTTTTTTPTAKTLTLTSGVDTGTDFTGGGAGDTFVADNTPTLDASSTADTLDGGAGSDTLIIYSDGGAPGLPSLTSIETVKIYDQNADVTFDAIDQASVTTVDLIRGDGALTLTVPVNVGAVGLTNITLDGTGGLTGITVAGAATATAMTLNVDRISTNAGTTDENIAITGAKIATVNVNAIGTKSSVDDLDVAGAATINLDASVGFTASNILTTSTTGTLNITGAGAVSIGALDDGIDTVAAGNATGAITMTAPNDNADAVITLGSGADVFTTDDDGFATTDKFVVDAGAGTDTLVQAAADDFDTAAEGARYKNFETLRSAVDQDMSLVAGLTGLEVTGGTAKSYTKMTAAQLGNVKFTGNNTTSTTFTLADATGTADTATFTLASATATTNVDVIGVSVVGVETVNIVATTGTNTTGDSDFGFLANKADSVKAVNISGSADVDLNIVANTFDVVAATIDASGLTGTGHLEITGGVLVKGSKVIGSDNGDTIVVSTTTGTTYQTGAGDDKITSAAASLAQTGSDDNSIDAGAGTDTLHISDNGSTMTDNHFMGVSGAEKIVYDDGGAVSLTTGSAFASAFASGVTITAAGMDDAATFTYAGGTYTGDTTIALTSAGLGNATGENLTITTGAGADTVTVTASNWVGVAGDTSVISVTSGAGDDTITLKGYNLAANTTTVAIEVNAGTGKDTITFDGDNGAGATAYANITIAGGDSTLTAYDKITGFEVGDATNYSSALNFDGTAAKATAVTADGIAGYTSAELTYTISAAGILTFAGTSAASLTVAEALGIMDKEITTSTHTAIWTDGTDSYVFNAHANGDSVVHLAGLTGVDALITTAGTGANDLLIL